MDDLSGLEWSHSTPSSNPPAHALPALRPTPSPSASGRSTPLSLQQSASTGRVLKPPANDSFANLLGAASGKTTSNLSLQDRQKQLQEEKERQQAEERRKLDAHFGGSTATIWGNHGHHGSPLSSLTNKPGAASNPSTHLNRTSHDSEDDILAAFNASAPVDASSHFPPPQTLDSGRSTPSQASKPT